MVPPLHTNRRTRHLSSFNPLSHLVPMTNHTCPDCFAPVTLFLCPPPHVSYPPSPPPPIFIFPLPIHIPLSPRPPPFYILPIFYFSYSDPPFPTMHNPPSPHIHIPTPLPFHIPLTALSDPPVYSYSYPPPPPTYISSLSLYPMLSISPKPFFRHSRLLFIHIPPLTPPPHSYPPSLSLLTSPFRLVQVLIQPSPRYSYPSPPPPSDPPPPCTSTCLPSLILSLIQASKISLSVTSLYLPSTHKLSFYFFISFCLFTVSSFCVFLLVSSSNLFLQYSSYSGR
jgi:hypothetical protein